MQKREEEYKEGEKDRQERSRTERRGKGQKGGVYSRNEKREEQIEEQK